jgi:SAM-dependent methyltransferase
VNVVAHNRIAWNKESRDGSRWSTPVTAADIRAARDGHWSLILTPNQIVPRDWFGNIQGKNVLCLASGGGQQAPLLAAAGATVTSFDLSEEQLAKDRLVAERDSLELTTIQGDMANLSDLADESFDLIFHPVSNVFAPEILPVWRECTRVLRTNGRLLAGFMNPLFFLFDHDDSIPPGPLQVNYPQPYSDLMSLPESKRKSLVENNLALEFGHTLQDQIGGQISAGLVISGFYEDNWDDDATPLNQFAPVFIATLARKLKPE